MSVAALRDRLERQRAARQAGPIPFCPHTPTPAQARFLEADAKEVLYGGAAGGGKSECLLMDQLRFCERPGFHGLILRRTLPDLALPGAIMDRAKAWLIPRGVGWNDKAKLFVFKSGARLQFGYCETANDVYRYQGAEFHRISIDELTQWQEAHYLYLLSRLRRKAGDDIEIGMRAGTNPGGVGHAWVKRRWIKPGGDGRMFVPAKIEDNPHLNREEYEQTLSLLDGVTRAQLRDGEWIDSGEGLVYKYARGRNSIDSLPDLSRWHPILAVDLGSSESTPTTAFAFMMWHEDDPRVVVVRCWAEAGLIPATIAERVKSVVADHPECRVIVDIGALGAGYANEMRSRYRIPVEPAEKANKLGFRKLLNGALERAEVVLTDECPGLVEELESLPWAKGGLDNVKGRANHHTDALLYGWRAAQSWRAAFKQEQEEQTEEQRWQERIKARHQAAKRDPFANW